MTGAGNSTKVTFVKGETPDTETFISAIFWSQNGDVLDTASVFGLTPNSTRSVIFSGGDDLKAGHIEFVTDSEGVVATETIFLSIPGVGNASPIGVLAAPSCKSPVAGLTRNSEFDTGVALSNTSQEPVSCIWSIYV